MRRAGLPTVVVILAAIAFPSSGAAGSLPSVSSGPLPGPDVLYEPLATAPQLENAGGWSVESLMVSGADAYADGEYLYQDFIYDSFGANTTDLTLTRPETVPNSSDTLFGGMTGDVVYPTAARYANNAADLLEFRARLADGAIAYRVTLNTVLEHDVAIVAIGRDAGADGGPVTDWGRGLGTLGAPVDDVVFTWGAGAALGDASLPSSIDVERNQIDVIAPLPGDASVVRHYLAVGLYDAATGSFKRIGEQPTATEPGGANGRDVPPIFNVGFRFDEPLLAGSMGDADLVGESVGAAGARGVGAGHFRDHAQALALAERDISAFYADIDLTKLADEVDESHVPRTGWLNRLYVSHLDLGEGVQATRPMLLGRIQPYGLYVPTTYAPGRRAPLHLLLHSLSCTYNQYAVFSPRTLQQLGEQREAIVLAPEGRGPDGWWHHEAEVDVFEAWADVAARYDLEPDGATLGGYSMGGYGTYKLAAQYPDLFSKGFAVVGPADEDIFGGPTGGAIEDDQNTLHIVGNLANVPLWMWAGVADELVPIAGVLRFEQRLAELGLRHELRVFPADHFLLATWDDWSDGREFLGDGRVDRDPSFVSYRAMPEMDVPALGLVHDHAYWVADVRVASGARSGLVEARSLARGDGAPTPHEYAGPGTRPMPYVARGMWWLSNQVAPANALTVRLEDVASASLWIERAGIDPSQPIAITIEASGSGTLTLRGSFGAREIAYGAGTTTESIAV